MNTLGKIFFAGALAILSAGLGTGLTAVSAAVQEAKHTIMPEDAGVLAFQDTVGYSDAAIANAL